MTEDFATIAAKRLEIIEAGFSGDENIVRAALSHASGDVRSSALSSLHRLHVLSATELGALVVDVSYAAMLPKLPPTLLVSMLFHYSPIPMYSLLKWQRGLWENAATQLMQNYLA